MQVLIPEEAWIKTPDQDAEVFAYDEQGRIVGCALYESPLTVITLWGDDQTTGEKDGLHEKEQIHYRIANKNGSSPLRISNWREGTSDYQVNEILIAASVEIESQVIDSELQEDRFLVKMINILGQEVSEEDTRDGMLLFKVYSDGSVEKFLK